MKRYVTAILALAIGGAASTYLPVRADTQGAQPANQQMTPADQKVTEEVQNRLASAVDKAVSVSGYEGMVGSFDKTTRDRLALEKDRKLDELNTRIAQFRRDFKDKYNQDFNLNAAELKDIAVYTNGDEDHSVVHLSAFPTLNAKNDAATGDKDRQNLNGHIYLNREKTLIGNAWRIAMPENISGQQLRDALGSKLAAIDNDQAAWPTNVHDGYITMGGQILQTLTQLQPGTNATVENR